MDTPISGNPGSCWGPDRLFDGASRAWGQQSAGTCPNSWRDGFARDCPLRHPVAWVLALRDRSGAHRRFLVVCGAISAVTGGAPEKRGTTEARWQPVCRRSSREPGFVVRGGRSRDPSPLLTHPGDSIRPGGGPRGGWGGRLGAWAAVEREPEAGRGTAAAPEPRSHKAVLGAGALRPDSAVRLVGPALSSPSARSSPFARSTFGVLC